MLVVIRLGGSVIASPIDPELINQYVKLLKELKTEGYKIVTIVGGGSLAREFIKTGKQMGLKEEAQDWLAIHVSRLYAVLFTLKLGNETGGLATSIDEVVQALNKEKIVVMGGLKPGMTTDAVAAYAAEEIKAKLLVKATNQEGIYTKDPKKYEDAEKLDRLSYSDLEQLFEQNRHTAGIHQILDPVAVSVLKKNKIKTVVVNGYKPANIKYAIEGMAVGTIVME